MANDSHGSQKHIGGGGLTLERVAAMALWAGMATITFLGLALIFDYALGG